MKVFPRVRATYALSLALCAVLLLALAVPAAAARPAGKGKPGKAAKAETTQVTEDNDTNDGDTPNNVADDGDNRHPSGKDRSVERGGSGNQGKSASDPDGDSNGGLDKPDGPGGVDLADQDGNNGCGNDDDFEDDNNGNCGPKVRDAAEEPVTEPGNSCTPGTAGCDEGTEGDEDSCTPGTAGCDEDGDVDTAEGSCSHGSETCTDTDETCGADVPECTGDADTTTDVDGDTATDGSVDTDGGDTDLGEVLGSEGEVEGETDVAGVAIERTAPEAGRVLGATDSLPTSGVADVLADVTGVDGALAATGVPALLLGLLALAGIGTGAGLVRRSRKR